MAAIFAPLLLLLTAVGLFLYAVSDRQYRYARLAVLGISIISVVLVVIQVRFSGGEIGFLTSAEGPSLFIFKADSISQQLGAPTALLGAAAVLLYMQLSNRRQIMGWAGIYLINGLALAAVSAGNFFTIIFLWALLDITSVLIQLRYSKTPNDHKFIWWDYALKSMSSLMLVGLTAVNPNLNVFSPFDSSPISQLAAAALGMRLGLIPFMHRFRSNKILQPGIRKSIQIGSFGAAVAVIPRLNMTSDLSDFSWIVFILILAAAVYAAAVLLSTRMKDESVVWWLAAGGALTLTASLFSGGTAASLAWGSAVLYTGGILVLSGIQHIQAGVLFGMLLLGFAGLPFTPFHDISQVYIQPGISPAWSLLIPQGLLGLSILRMFFFKEVQDSEVISADIWETGAVLALLVLPWLLMFSNGLPPFQAAKFIPGGIFFLIIITGTWAMSRKNQGGSFGLDKLISVISIDWIYAFMEMIFSAGTTFNRFIESLLEEEGGMLWIILVLLVILTTLQGAAGF